MKWLVLMLMIAMVLVDSRRRRRKRSQRNNDDPDIDIESIVKVINNKAKVNLVAADLSCREDNQGCVVDGVDGKCMTVTIDNMTGLYSALDMAGPAQGHVQMRDTQQFMCVKDLTYLNGQDIERRKLNKARSLKKHSFRHKDKYMARAMMKSTKKSKSKKVTNKNRKPKSKQGTKPKRKGRERERERIRDMEHEEEQREEEIHQ